LKNNVVFHILSTAFSVQPAGLHTILNVFLQKWGVQPAGLHLPAGQAGSFPQGRQKASSEVFGDRKILKWRQDNIKKDS